MGVVGVAGGTSGLGRNIVDALKASGKHEIIIFSRNEKLELAQELGIRIVAVDYGSVESIQSVLEANDVDTVIDTINSVGDVSPELNLYKASDRSSTTKRLIPSIFAGFAYPIKYPDSSVAAKAKAVLLREADKTTLQYTAFFNGFFLDYWGSPAFPSHFPPAPLYVDIANGVAAIPGTGNELVAFLHTTDLAKFVVAILDLAQWPKESWIVGDKITWNKFVELAEEVKGTKFKVVHNSVTDLNAGKVSWLAGYENAFAGYPQEAVQALLIQAGIHFAEGELDINPTDILNTVFPDIQFLSVKKFLELSWGKKSS